MMIGSTGLLLIENYYRVPPNVRMIIVGAIDHVPSEQSDELILLNSFFIKPVLDIYSSDISYIFY